MLDCEQVANADCEYLLTITNTLDLSQKPRELHIIQEVPGVFMFMYKEIFYLFTFISTKK